MNDMKKKLFLVIALALVMVLALSAVAMADTAIKNVNITAVSSVTVGERLGNSYSSSGSGYSFVTYKWVSGSHLTYDSVINSETRAVAGEKYTYQLYLKPNSGYYFPGKASGYESQYYDGTFKVNGEEVKGWVEKGTGYLYFNADWMTATAAEDTEITNVSVYAADSVTVGERLGNYYKSSGSHYTFKRIMWRSKTHDVLDSYISTETKAEAGESYRYRLYLKPDSGYCFPGEYEGYSYKSFQGTVKLNGKTVQGFVDTDGALFVESDWMTAGTAEPISNVELTITAPKVGAKPATSFKAVNKTNDVALSQKHILWYEYNEKTKQWDAITTSTFQEGKQYRVQMVVYPESGYFAGAENSTKTFNDYEGTVTVNGSKATSSNSNVYATGEDGTSFKRCLVVQYNFASAPVITKQPTPQTAVPGGDAVFTVEASGENLKYQWYGGTDAAPTKVGGNSNKLTLTDLSLNNNDTDFWCVISNDAGSVTSNKAKLTVSDNYVMPFTDVKPNDWFYNDVKIANQMKLIDGKTPTLFKPYDNMTYAEAIKLAACMSQYYNAGAITLKPASGSGWYQPYVDYAKTHGIPWSFDNYNAMITRADYVYIFYYALPASDYKQLNSLGLADIPDVGPSTFASSEILTLYNAGILRGSDDLKTGVKGYFKPDDNIRRSEVAAILTRMMNKDTRLKYSL